MLKLSSPSRIKALSIMFQNSLKPTSFSDDSEKGTIGQSCQKNNELSLFTYMFKSFWEAHIQLY